jgi:uncharacterized protein (DUF433 family)
MTIEARGEQGTLVLAASGVPIYDIADAVITEYNIDWICERYPVTTDEVFEVVDAMTNLLQDWGSGLLLANTGSAEHIDLETVKVSDTVFFNLISYARQFNNKTTNLDTLYRIGLNNVIKEVYQALQAGTLHLVVETNELHNIVYEAILTVLGDLDPEQIIKALEKQDV